MSKYQKRISVGAFLKKGEDIKDNDIVEIANAGRKVPGNFGIQDVFLIKTATKEGNVAFNQTSINNLIDGYGDESINWIGKKVKVLAMMQGVSGKMKMIYYFLHPDTVLNEKTGEFIIPERPEVKSDDIPIIEDYGTDKR